MNSAGMRSAIKRTAKEMAPVTKKGTKKMQKTQTNEDFNTLRASEKKKHNSAHTADNGKDAPEGKRKLLLKLGPLVSGRLVRRPSRQNRSPYCCDVDLGGGSEVVAHCPMLGLGGQLVPGVRVSLTVSRPGGATSHAVQLVEGGGGVWVGAHPALGNTLARALLQGELGQQLLGGPLQSLQAEVTLPHCQEEGLVHSEDQTDDSKESNKKKGKKPTKGVENKKEEKIRADFVLNGDLVVEVKSVVCAAGEEGSEIEGEVKRMTGAVAAEFPVGRQGQIWQGNKVVSARCIKHLRHLSAIAAGQDPLVTTKPIN